MVAPLTTIVTGKILIVEDEKSLRDTLRDMFTTSGYEVEVAENGQEALDLVFSTNPDVIITDISMPVMDGYEFVQEIKKTPQGNKIPILMLTAKVSEEEKIRGLNFGAVDYITKPFSYHELQLKIQNHLKLTSSKQDDQEEVESSQFLKTVNNYLDSHMNDGRLELEVVAENFRLSSSGLQKKIRRLTDKSYSRYVREYRLKKAHSLLESNQYSIGEVATMVGFATNSYFSESFREVYGYVPSKLLS